MRYCEEDSSDVCASLVHTSKTLSSADASSKANVEDYVARNTVPTARLLGFRVPTLLVRSVLVCGTGNIIAFCAQNVLQELATIRMGTRGHLGVAFTASEALWCTCVPAIELLAAARREAAAAHAWRELGTPRLAMMYAAMAVVLGLSTGVANVAVEYISVGTLVVLKSAKLLPVMAVGIVCFRKSHTGSQWLAAALLVVGVVLCVRSDARSKRVRFHVEGLLLVGCALVGDAIYPFLQEKMLLDRRPLPKPPDSAASSHRGAAASPAATATEQLAGGAAPADVRQLQVLVGTNVFVLLYCAIAMLAASLNAVGETPAASLMGEAPVWVIAVLVFHGLLQYVGLVFYLALLQAHSPRTAVGVATVRKAVSVLLAALLAGRAPGTMYAIGATGVLAAALVERGTCATATGTWARD